MTHYLKFTDEDHAISILSDYRNEDGWMTASHSHALDPVGPLGDPPEGFHVNFVGELPEEVLPFVVLPSTPSRIFME